MDLCHIATITGFHGVAGGVTVQFWSDAPGRLDNVETVLVGVDDLHAEPMTIASVRTMPGKTVITFEGLDSRNAVEHLRGWKLFVPEDSMVPPPEGRHYVHDLLGCEVFTTDGRYVGVLKDVMMLPASDTYVVDANGQEVLIPAVPEFITSVDITAKRITVHEIPGLLDLEEADED